MTLSEILVFGGFLFSALLSGLVEMTACREINEHLPKSMRLGILEKRSIHVMKLHKQFYPESSLRLWFWIFSALTVVFMGVGAYLKSLHHR